MRITKIPGGIIVEISDDDVYAYSSEAIAIALAMTPFLMLSWAISADGLHDWDNCTTRFQHFIIFTIIMTIIVIAMILYALAPRQYDINKILEDIREKRKIMDVEVETETNIIKPVKLSKNKYLLPGVYTKDQFHLKEYSYV